MNNLKASKSRAFSHRYTWLIVHESSLNSSSLEDLLDSVEILPDADVTWSSADAAVEVYRVKGNQPLIVTPLEMTRHDSLEDMERMWNELPSTVTRRKNLRNVFLKSATVVSTYPFTCSALVSRVPIGNVSITYLST